jgi:hypothetical protein
MINLNQINTLEIVSTVLSSISLAAVIIIIIGILKWGNLKTFATEIVLLLMLQEMMVSIAFLLPTDPIKQIKNGVCQTQSILISFFTTTSQIWVVFIAFTAWHTFNSTELVEESKWKYRFIYFGISYPSAIAITLA